MKNKSNKNAGNNTYVKNKPNIDESAIVHLFHNPKFLSDFEKINTEAEIIRIFNKNNIPITFDDLEVLHNICEKYVNKGLEILDEETFLENVSAGTDNYNNGRSTAKKIVDILSPNYNDSDYEIKKHFME